MPIYAYRCDTCGFQQDVLQKMSDARLVTCPSCGNATFQKQVTAAGFQLKGSGWYVTDFRNPAAKEGSKASKPDPAGDGGGEGGADKGGGETKADGAAATSASAASPAATAAATDSKPATPAAKPAPSGTD